MSWAQEPCAAQQEASASGSFPRRQSRCQQGWHGGPPSKHTSPAVGRPPLLTTWASPWAASPPAPRAGETGRVHPEHSPGPSMACCQRGGAISPKQCALRERGGHGQPHGAKPAPGLAGLSGVFCRSRQLCLQNVPVVPSRLPGLVPRPPAPTPGSPQHGSWSWTWASAPAGVRLLLLERKL